MKRLNSDARFLIVMTVLFAGATVFFVRGASESTSDEWWPVRTTYSSRSGGIRALWLTLRALDYRTVRFRQPLTKLPTRGVLFIIEPSRTSLASEEWQELVRWVRAGNIAVLASDQRGAGLGLPLRQTKTGIGSILVPDSEHAQPVQLDPLTAGVADFHIKTTLRLSDSEWAPPDLLMGMPFPRGKLGKLGKGKSKSLPFGLTIQQNAEPPQPLTPLLRDRRAAGVARRFTALTGVVAATSQWGKGLIMLLASPASLANDGIGQADNFVLVLNLLRQWNPQRQLPVLFDEFHHGFGEKRTLASLFGPPARMAGAQLALVALGWLWLVARRRSRAIPLPAEGQRARGEYLSAVALLYKRARAREVARQALGQEFLREVTRLLALPMAATLDEITRTAQTLHGVNPDELRTGLGMSGPGGTQALHSDAELLRFAQGLHVLREAIAGRSN